MNHRLTMVVATAVILASVSIYPLTKGIGWFFAGAGAVIVVAAAGTATRLPALPAGMIAAALAAVAAAPLLTSPAWYQELIGMALVITVAGSITRLRPLPLVAGAVTYLGGLLIYLNLVFAGPESFARIVPTSQSLRHLLTLASQGIGERIYAPPVPESHGVQLLAAAGIGLMAVAADLMAVRLRSPAIAGLPLLALFSVPITTSARQGAVGATVTFCLGIGGYLWVLSADGRARLRIWGRLVTLWQSGRDDDDQPARGPDTRALAASGRRIGLAAISLAIFIPVLLPGLRAHKLFSGHGTGGAPGSASITLPDPAVRLHTLLLHGGKATVLTYTTNNPDPQQQYLQVYVLNYNAGTHSWSLQAPVPGVQVVSNAPLPQAQGLSGVTPGHTSTTRITVSRGVTGYGSRVNFLPLPYVPQTIQVTGNWQVDLTTLMVSSVQVGLSGLDYRVKSEDVQPSVQQLDQAPAPLRTITRQYLSFPSPVRSTLLNLANQVTATAGARTSYQKAVALQKWFTSGFFKYNVHATEPDTPAGLVKFLTTSRQGYCQQFAFGMAALARVLGIPSRIAVGFTAGTRQSRGNWKVTTADAHAWPELYFQGAGWLRFEPTPGGPGGQGTAVQPAYALATAPGGPGTTTPQPGSSASPGGIPGATNPSGLADKLNRLPGLNGQASRSRGSSVPVFPIVIAVLALAAVTPRTTRTLARQRRWHAAKDDGALAHAGWLELHDDLTDYGIGWRASESPRAVSRRLGATLRLDPASQQALDRVTRAEERARYATVAQAPESLRADVTAIRRAIAAKTGRAARWRARLLPPSALVPVRSGLQQALDVFGWLDAAGLRVRRRVRQFGRES